MMNTSHSSLRACTSQRAVTSYCACTACCAQKHRNMFPDVSRHKTRWATIHCTLGSLRESLCPTKMVCLGFLQLICPTNFLLKICMNSQNWFHWLVFQDTGQLLSLAQILVTDPWNLSSVIWSTAWTWRTCRPPPWSWGSTWWGRPRLWWGI